jgi:hypothetical protein
MANRSLNQREADRLIDQMRSTTFESTGELVIVSRKGYLNDNQHRLVALVEVDVVVSLDVRLV